MLNQVLSKIFREMAVFLEIKGVAFKPQAYEKVSEVLENLEEDVKDIYKNGDLKALENIPGVGASIAEHIEEWTSGLSERGRVDEKQRRGGLFPCLLKARNNTNRNIIASFSRKCDHRLS